MYILLIEAAAAGDSKRIGVLIESGANVDASDMTGRTALHLASAEGHEEIVRLLLMKGATPNVRDHFGREALEEAIANGHGNVMKDLIRGGARLSECSRQALEMKLAHSAAIGDLKSVKNLVECGMMNRGADLLRSTLLSIAETHNQEHVVEYLREGCANIMSSLSEAETSKQVYRRKYSLECGALPLNEPANLCQLMIDGRDVLIHP
jgi:hypothetical protein